ncbi:MAG TPA: peptidase M48 [Gammaproteobacteria bacterium]|nr:peptidase M48 [Gammaproteobacteria bacterium]
MIYTVLFLLALATSLTIRLWLEHRQIKQVLEHRPAVPAAFEEKISLQAHQKAADYTVERTRFGRWEMLYDALLILMWTLGGGLQAIYNLANQWGFGELTTGVITILLLGFISSLLGLPFSLYRTFSIEARHGFNRTTRLTYLVDMLKGTLLALAFGVPLIYLVLWLMQSSGSFWWIYAWASLLVFSLFISWAFPTFIAPLFNKFTPLEQDDLNTAIQNLLDRSGFKSKGIFVMDGSRRSSHGNAYFTGLGKGKRIVFFDTLIESLTSNQIVAVLAHELGHFKHKHIFKGLIIGAISSLIGFGILAWLLPKEAFYHGLGVTSVNLTLGLLLFMMVSPLFSFFLNPVSAWHSRKNEYEADAYAASQSSANDLITALVKMYEDNASTLTPDDLHSAFYDSHPPALARINHLQQLA